MFNSAREDLRNMHHRSRQTETATENRVSQDGIRSSYQQPFVSGIVSRSRSVMRVLHTHSCSISTCSNHPNANLAIASLMTFLNS